MNRIATLVLTLLLASSAFAQSRATSAVTDADGIPTVAAQMHLFATHLQLTHQQRAEARTILDDLHAATVSAVHDTGVSPEQRFARIRDARLATDHKLRAVLTDDQQKKLDQLEHEPHPELHGSIRNAAALSPQ